MSSDSPAGPETIKREAAETSVSLPSRQDFRGFSYGFRPGRSQHQALDALYVAITRKKVNDVLDADIRGFFDNLDMASTNIDSPKMKCAGVAFGEKILVGPSLNQDGTRSNHPGTWKLAGLVHN